MKQDLEQFMSIAQGMWRRRWQAIGVTWAVVLAGWTVVYLTLLPSYTARAQIYVDTETVLRPLLKGLTVEVNRSEQLGLMTRQLMSRPNLEHVIRQTGLDRQERNPEPFGVALEKLSKNVSLQAERTSSEARNSNFYVITYRNKDPELAKQVVRSLIDAFAENTLAEIRQDADRAKLYPDQQIAEHQERLEISENRLREFKRKNVNLLPRHGTSYFERLQSEQADLEKVELDIQQMESLRNALQVQLAVTPSATRALSANGQPILTPLETRLMAFEAKLDGLLLKYTEEHPDVVETRSSIRQLKEQQKGASPPAPTMPNPVYQQLALRLKDVEGQLAGLRTKREAYRERVEDLQKQIGTLPAVEDELQRLTKEYELNVENHRDLVARRQSMEMSESVGLNNEDLKFRVVEPPNVPVELALRSVWKKRLLLTTVVLLAGLSAGMVLAYALAQLRPGIFTQRALSELTGLPVYGVIPRVATFSMRLRQRLDPLAFGATGLLLMLAYATVLLIPFSSIPEFGAPAADWLRRLLASLT